MAQARRDSWIPIQTCLTLILISCRRCSFIAICAGSTQPPPCPARLLRCRHSICIHNAEALLFLHRQGRGEAVDAAKFAEGLLTHAHNEALLQLSALAELHRIAKLCVRAGVAR